MMNIRMLSVVAVSLFTFAIGCAAPGESEDPQPAQGAVDVTPDENASADPKQGGDGVNASGDVSPSARPPSICRWMTCLENGERFKCWVCY